MANNTKLNLERLAKLSTPGKRMQTYGQYISDNAKTDFGKSVGDALYKTGVYTEKNLSTPSKRIQTYGQFISNNAKTDFGQSVGDAIHQTGVYTENITRGINGMIRDGAREFTEKLGEQLGRSYTSDVKPAVAPRGQYQSRLSDGRVAPASSVTGESAPSAIPAANEEIVATAKSYNAAPATEPGVSPPASEESVSEAKSYNGGYQTDAVGATSYSELLNERQQLIDKSKSEAYKEADDQLNIDMRDAQANYQQNNPRYGATAENLLEQGLGDSGYGEYLAGKREEQLTDERMAARSRHSYARLAADNAHDAATLDLNTMRGQYSKELDAEFKAAYNEIIAAVNAGTYSAELGEKILSQYAGGSVSADVVSALKSAESKAMADNKKSVIGAFLDAVHTAGAKPTEAGLRQWLETNAPNITETEIQNLMTGYFKDGKLDADAVAGEYQEGTIKPSELPKDENGNTITVPDGYDYVSDADLVSTFESYYGRKPSDSELAYAKSQMQSAQDGWFLKKGTSPEALFGVEKQSSNTSVKSAQETLDLWYNSFSSMEGEIGDFNRMIDDMQNGKNGLNINGKTIYYDGATVDMIVNTADGLVVSSGVYNNNGGFRKDYSDGDDFSVVINGDTYRVESQGEASAKVEAAAASVGEGVVFGYGRELYIKGAGGKAYKIGARPILFNGHYDKLWTAVYGEAFKNINITDGTVGRSTITNEGHSIVGGKNENADKKSLGDKISDLFAKEDPLSTVRTRGYARVSKEANDNGKMRVNVDGKHYKVALGEKADANASEWAKSNGVNENEVFIYNGKAYVQLYDGVYSVDKRALGGIAYNNMLKAIAANGKDRELYTDEAVSTQARVINIFGGEMTTEKIDDFYVGRNLRVELDGERYQFDIDAKLGSSSDAYNASKNIEVGTVFAHGEDLYIKGTSYVYKLGARDMIYNGAYDKFKKAVSGYTTKAVDDNGIKALTGNEGINVAMKNDGSLFFDSRNRLSVDVGGKEVKIGCSAISANTEDSTDKAAYDKLLLKDGDKYVYTDGMYAVNDRIYIKNGDKVYWLKADGNYDKLAKAFFAAPEEEVEYPFGNYSKNLNK